MSSANQMFAVVAIAAYLSAALLPCEKDVYVVASVPSEIGTHAMGAAEFGMASTSHPPHHVDHEKIGDQNHDAHHGAHPRRNAEVSHHRVAMKSTLVWMPTCLCGCGDTRATVGGGAARLGPVVPPTPATAWPTEIVRVAKAPVPRPIPAPDSLIDPIPT